MVGLNLLLILIGVFLNASAQPLLKKGMCSFGAMCIPISKMYTYAWKIIANGYIISGLTCYVVSVVVWLMVLSRVAVSVAYPMLSIGYIVTAIAGHYLFDENVTWLRIAGIIVIIVGVYLVSKSA